MSSGDSSWLKSQKAAEADSAAAATSADTAASAENGTSAVKSERKPSFTASAGAPEGAASAATASATTSTGTGTAYATPSSYQPPPASAPAGGTGAPPLRNGYSSSNGFSAGASAVGGAAAGLASSVTSAWQRRGSAKNIQARKPAKSTKRQAMLTLARVEPWSVMKFSFVASVVAFIILFVAVAVLYMVLSALGVFDSLQNTVSSITSSQSSKGTNISHYFSASLILGYTAMLGALNIVLITAMSTVGSVIYNLIAKTIGGIEVTLRETD